MNGSWLAPALLRTDAHTRVFCLPHAGAGASAYRLWAHELPPALQLCAVQLPGRENRLGERAIDDVRTMVRELAAGLRPFLDRPFVMFGHSMGALLAFELTCELRRTGLPQPRHLFLSAHRAPHLPGDLPHVHTRSPQEFRAELRRLEGTPAAVLEHEELMQIAEPILRADFKLCETYAFEPVEPLDVPLSIFGGVDDTKVPEAVLQPWQQHTRVPIRLRVLPGGHLFVQQCRTEVLSAMLDDLHVASCRLTL
jgi:medium-chain acyl-[acyl-carrier-protein] hydrolase